MKLTVNQLEIPQSVIERELEHAHRLMPEANEDQIKEKVKETLVRQAILRAHALRHLKAPGQNEIDSEYFRICSQHGSEADFLKNTGLTAEQIPLLKDDISVNLRVQKHIESLTRDLVMPNETLLREYFDREPSLNAVAEQRHVRHILQRPGPGTYEAMCALRAKLKNGADFIALANAESQTGEKDGDLGYIARGQTVVEFDDIVFSMDEHEISPVFRTVYGYHIALVETIRARRSRTFEEALEDVKAFAYRQMADGVVNHWIDQQLETADVDFEL